MGRYKRGMKTQTLTIVLATAIFAVMAYTAGMSFYASHQAIAAGRAWQGAYESTLNELNALKASADCTVPVSSVTEMHGGRLIFSAD